MDTDKGRNYIKKDCSIDLDAIRATIHRLGEDFIQYLDVNQVDHEDGFDNKTDLDVIQHMESFLQVWGGEE